MSSSEQVPGPSQQQQQQPRMRKPPFADWPTIKILTPPQGRFSPKTDEWCFTYCTQSVSGRIHGKEPNCHTICLRRVFPHEVRNVPTFQSHKNVGPDGKAKYLLPAEGQSANLPRLLGGSKDVVEEDSSKPVAAPPKYWDEGWYLWTAKGRWAVVQKTEKMMLDLRHQQKLEQIRQSRKEVWQDYQEQLKLHSGDKSSVQEPTAPWWGPIVVPKNAQDVSSLSLLVPLPPEFPPLLSRVQKLLAPTYEVLGILHESITSGEQKKFAERVWEKAKTDEPFILAKRTFTHAYEQWKKRDIPEEDDEKKGST